MSEDKGEVTQSLRNEGIGQTIDLAKILRGEKHKSELPQEFTIGQTFLAGVERLVPKPEDVDVENGGTIVNGATGEIRIVEGQRSITYEDQAWPITKTNVSHFANGERLIINPKTKRPFVRVLIAEENAYEGNEVFFKEAEKLGIKVVLGEKIGVAHSHPSGNFPSPNDIAATVYHGAEGKLSEIVVTPEWTYFIVPTIETPDMFITDEHRAQLEPMEKIDMERKKIQDSGHHLPGEGSLNEARYRMLKNICEQQNVAFYSMRKGQNIAKRIF